MNVLLVVSDVSGLGAGETTIRSRLQGQGHTVTVHDEADDAPSLATTDLVILGPTCNQNIVGSKYSDILVGVISMFVDPHINMSESQYAVNGAPATTYYASEPGDVLLGGLTGTITMINSLSEGYLYYTDSTYGTGVVNVMRFNSSSDRVTLARIAQGGTMWDGSVAPTRRVFFGIPDAWFPLFTADAWTIFDNAVTWTSVEPAAFPVANAGPDQEVGSNVTVQLSGSGTDSDGTITGYTWRLVSTTGPTPTLSSTTAQNPTFTSPLTSATFVFGLRVTDSQNLPSPEDTVTIQVVGRLATKVAISGSWQDKPLYIAKSGSWQ
jgi:hypothetical protein